MSVALRLCEVDLRTRTRESSVMLIERDFFERLGCRIKVKQCLQVKMSGDPYLFFLLGDQTLYGGTGRKESRCRVPNEEDKQQGKKRKM